MGFSCALHAPGALQGAHSCGAICSFMAFESQTSHFPPPLYHCKPRGTSITSLSVAPSCVDFAFLAIRKPWLADSSVTAAERLIPSDPLPMAICHLPILNSPVFRGDSKTSLYPSTVSQLCLMPASCLTLGLGCPPCPQGGAGLSAMLSSACKSSMLGCECASGSDPKLFLEE